MASSSKRPKLTISEEKLKHLMTNEKDKVLTINFARKGDYEVFKRVIFDDQETNYVICTSCNDQKLIRYDTAMGNASIRRHLSSSYHTKKPNHCVNQPSIKNFVAKSVPMRERQKIYDSMALWIATENRSFNIVEGKHFKNMIQTIIQVTSRIGMIDVDQIVPCKQTVRNHTDTLYQKIKLNLTSFLETIDSINCTTDHWKDNQSSANYMTISIHYYNKK